MTVSAIIPCFNAETTIERAILSVVSQTIPVSEIIVVNDGSTDATSSILKKLQNKNKQFTLINHSKNQGKGAAVRTAIKKAKGDYIVIQDADLEYDPKDIVMLLQPVLANQAKVVYGTRLRRMPDFSRDERTIRFFTHYMGNKFLSLTTSILYFNWITDMECCYKLFPRKALDGVTLHARGFEFEPEITAKLLKKGFKIIEIPISTNPRGYDEGKKLDTVRDGIKAVWTLVKYKVVN